MTTEGTAKIKITTPSASVLTNAVVAPQAADQLLIGYKDLKRLNVIPPEFPVAMCTKTSDFDKLKEEIFDL